MREFCRGLADTRFLLIDNCQRGCSQNPKHEESQVVVPGFLLYSGVRFFQLCQRHTSEEECR